MRLSLCIVLLYSLFTCGNAAGTTNTPPCCRDTLTTCQTTRNKDLTGFRNRCNTEADFRLIQCCATCEIGAIRDYNTVALTLANAACFDRESASFCAKYVAGTGAYAASTWSCDGASAAVAFRVCRRSCGYCTSGTTAATVVYDYNNAIMACSSGK